MTYVFNVLGACFPRMEKTFLSNGTWETLLLWGMRYFYL